MLVVVGEVMVVEEIVGIKSVVVVVLGLFFLVAVVMIEEVVEAW